MVGRLPGTSCTVSVIQVLGPVRVPLLTLADGVGGLSNFLSHRFIGNTRDQLIHALTELQLMAESDIQAAEAAYRAMSEHN